MFFHELNKNITYHTSHMPDLNTMYKEFECLQHKSHKENTLFFSFFLFSLFLYTVFFYVVLTVLEPTM